MWPAECEGGTRAPARVAMTYSQEACKAPGYDDALLRDYRPEIVAVGRKFPGEGRVDNKGRFTIIAASSVRYSSVAQWQSIRLLTGGL